jgi:hypothetical protein
MQKAEQTYCTIYNYQLSFNKNKYDIETLEYNIDNLGLRKLLQTQKLTPEFCAKYILNPEKYGMCREDHYLCDDDILLYQKHISKDDLMNAKERENERENERDKIK